MYTWEKCYENGSCVVGDVYTETVSIGGVTLNNQTIDAARGVTSNFKQTNVFGGILGLSFGKSVMGKVAFNFICQVSSNGTKDKRF